MLHIDSRMKNYARTPDVHALPSLIEVQLNSYKWFIEEGLTELFDEINPIENFNGNLRLYFPGNNKETEEFELTYWFEEPKYSEEAMPRARHVLFCAFVRQGCAGQSRSRG
jgi:DNA-directed RNA polymerase subunit beta